MKKMKTYKFPKPYIALSGFLIFFNLMTGQAQVLQHLQGNFSEWQKVNLHEKIYVQTDKNFYTAGEIIWFKVYNIDGSTNKPIDISKVVYVELLDNNYTPAMQAKVLMNDGTGNGCLTLPQSLNTGNYELRAYTNWMKNFEADYFFQKQITVINPARVTTRMAAEATADYDVQFFPEGGQLVAGLESRLAFKIIGNDGKGLAGTGVIVNKQNDTIARFNTLKFGMGSFNFKPVSQAAYKAIIKAGDKTVVKDLPAIGGNGYVIRAIDGADSYNVSIQSAGVTGQADVYIIVSGANTVQIAEQVRLQNGHADFVIDKNKLAGGVNTLTVFDGEGKPVCERLVFKKPGKQLLISANVDQQQYQERQKVNLTISSHGMDNTGIPANLSLSVYRADSLQKNDSAHIAAYVWLCAYLRGRIERPDYYFDQTNQDAGQALDNLLLTQGWRQFDWTNTSPDQVRRFNYLPEFTGPIVTANITTSEKNRSVKNVIAYLTVAGPNHQLYVAKSDAAGKLLFNTKSFYGVHELIAQTKWTQDSTYHIDIASPFSEQYAKEPLPALNLSPDIKETLIADNVNTQVQNIFETNQSRVFAAPIVDSVMFYGVPSYSYKLDDYTRFPTVEEVIHEYIKLVVITRDRGRMGLQVTDNKKFLPGEPLIMIDGKPVFDVNRTFSIDPLKVKRLDVVSTNYLYGATIFNGILDFTTYNGASTNMELDPRSVVVDYEGLQLERKFYSPVYDTQPQIDSTLPDFRSTLYWNPDAGTNKNGETKLAFYTGDRPGTYIGVIEGISVNGGCGSQSFIFRVKK